ncbi:MAG: hypothetical protein U0172_08360 [Nitrospiraceae bacterium]
MRERRWETAQTLTFDDVLALGDRLGRLGLKPVLPSQDIICYIEEWTVPTPEAFSRVDAWPTEDVTLVHMREGWHGDFFLLAGGYHTVYQRHEAVGTYCSVSHPWQMPKPLRRHEPRGMLWLGFRHTHSFVRVRLKTTEVVTPGETRLDFERQLWLDERWRAFGEAIKTLDVPIVAEIDRDMVSLHPADDQVPFFCSWPDAFGPCQFEYNTSDAFEFLVPASKLAATCGNTLVGVRAYLTGFSESALHDFESVAPGARYGYRCSAHAPLQDVPELLEAIAPEGRLYTTLCELQTQTVLPQGEDASAIVGLVGSAEGYRIELRLNRAPLPEAEMAPWVERLLGLPVVYAPLPPFVE